MEEERERLTGAGCETKHSLIVRGARKTGSAETWLRGVQAAEAVGEDTEQTEWWTRTGSQSKRQGRGGRRKTQGQRDWGRARSTEGWGEPDKARENEE
jgi:hypothetical protein